MCFQSMENTQAPESHVVCDGVCVCVVHSCPHQYLEDSGFNFAGFESRVEF